MGEVLSPAKLMGQNVGATGRLGRADLPHGNKRESTVQSTLTTNKSSRLEENILSQGAFLF